MEIDQKQTNSQLGTRLAIYRPGTGKVILSGILLVLIGLPCAIGGARISSSPTISDTSSNTLEGWLLTVGVGMSLCGLIAVLLALGNRKLRVDLYEQGFVAASKQGTKTILWHQVAHVWHKLEETLTTPVQTEQATESTPKVRKISTDVYVIACSDGTSWEINTSVYGLSKFVPVLEQTYPLYLLPQALASYQAGSPLTFGTLTVSATGVSNGKEQLAWGSFEMLAVDRSKGNITLRRGSEWLPWSSISVTDTPDLAVFEALVHTIASQPVEPLQ